MQLTSGLNLVTEFIKNWSHHSIMPLYAISLMVLLPLRLGERVQWEVPAGTRDFYQLQGITTKSGAHPVS
jgi:hypothetical protein